MIMTSSNFKLPELNNKLQVAALALLLLPEARCDHLVVAHLN